MRDFVELLEKNAELIRIKKFVNPELEISEITDRVVKNNGPALLFENTGTEYPLLINAFGSERRMCLALGINSLDEISERIQTLLNTFSSEKQGVYEKIKMLPKLKQLSDYFPKVKTGRGECQEVIINEPDIFKLPVLKCWPYDAGQFITLPIVHTKDPETSVRNAGMYRMQLFDSRTTGMHWHLHKGAAAHYEKYKNSAKKMPVAVALGGHPVYTYIATAPLPDNFDEYILAGFIRKKRVNLVKCISNNLEVPEDCDFIIEGYIDYNEEKVMEGPFGDHTGYYSLPDYYPKFHITCITHKKNAVYPATIVGIPPQEDAYIGKATERIFLMPMKFSIAPEIEDMNMPAEGVFHNIVLLKINKRYEGQPDKIMNALWGAGQMMFNKIMMVFDKDADLNNYESLLKIISENVNPKRDLLFSRGPLDVLDHSSDRFAYGSKIGIDATNKLSTEQLLQPIADEEKILDNFPEIKRINNPAKRSGIPLIILAIEKNKKNHFKEVAEKIYEYLTNIKFVIFLDSNIDIMDLSNVVWRAGNNYEPSRDTILKSNTVFFDCTAKTQTMDNFPRQWPEIIVMDKNTIEKVDKIWDELNIGNFIPSPSLKYAEQAGEGYIVKDK